MDEINILKNGGIGIYPTDTLYGIIGSAFSKKAVKRIYALKGRDESKPFIVLLTDISELKKFSVQLQRDQSRYLNSVWPGPVSVILPCLSAKFEYLHRDAKSIAFRIPKSKKIRKFLQAAGPLVAPSANPQGMTPARTIAEAKHYFGTHVDFYVSGGRKEGKPSKLVSLLEDEPKVLRA